ncbi:hypothetical protein CB1_000218008 [Camelus ferus]|nr:hypothetical protein CB1_000218008 [Camelus ferus]
MGLVSIVRGLWPHISEQSSLPWEPGASRPWPPGFCGFCGPFLPGRVDSQMAALGLQAPPGLWGDCLPISFDLAEYTADVDGVGTLRLLDAVKTCGLIGSVKFYQASTSELYGKVQEIPQKETTPFYPRSPYGAAKLYAYWIVVNFREAYNLFAVNGILFNHESPRRVREAHVVTWLLCPLNFSTCKKYMQPRVLDQVRIRKAFLVQNEKSLLRRATADVQLDEGKGPDLSSPTGTCGAFSVLVAAGQTLVETTDHEFAVSPAPAQLLARASPLPGGQGGGVAPAWRLLVSAAAQPSPLGSRGESALLCLPLLCER